jgi:hypothetical protein
VSSFISVFEQAVQIVLLSSRNSVRKFEMKILRMQKRRKLRLKEYFEGNFVILKSRKMLYPPAM